MNITQNNSYNGTANPLSSLGNFKYNPRTAYKTASKMPSGIFKSNQPTDPDYEAQQKKAAITQYGRLINEGMGIPTKEPFLPTVGDKGAPIPIPSDYGSFSEPASFDDSKLSWGTPKKPVIRNISVGGQTGQYVEDQEDRNLLVKTIRGNDKSRDAAIRAGRPGFLYQIDHIMPLNLGGTDTESNRQLLTGGQNDIKTKAQAVPYTLYAHGDISLTEARIMAMQWEGRDMTDIPQPNKIGFVSDTNGKTGIEIAREIKDRWAAPKKVGIKEVLAEIPETMKNLGEGWLPSPVREFVKGAMSGVTFGFLPYELDDDATRGSTTAGRVGKIVGSIGSFMLGGAAIGVGAKALLGTYRGVAGLAAAKNGYTAIKAAKGVANAAEATKVLKLSTLNKTPGYLKNLLTPDRIKGATKMGVTSAFVGQVHQFVENHFNTATLSGQEFEKTQENIIKNVMGDLALGAISGVSSPTLKGVAYSAGLPFTLSYLSDPDDPLGALTDAVVFGSMHAMGNYKKPGFNDVNLFGGKTYESPVLKSFEKVVNDTAYESLRHYAPKELPKIESGTDFAKNTSPEKIQKVVDVAIENVWKKLFFGAETSPELAKQTLSNFKKFSKNLNEGMDSAGNIPELKGWEKFSMSARRARAEKVKLSEARITNAFGEGYQTKNKFNKAKPSENEIVDIQAALTEIKRITMAGRQLYKGGLSKEMRNKADIDDLLSFGPNKLNERFSEQERFMNPSKVKKVVENIDESFFKHTLNNEPVNLNSKNPNGDFAVTGIGLNDVNIKATTEFMNKVATGEASRNIIIVRRPDLAPVMRMQNGLLKSRNAEGEKVGKDYGLDPNPENILQVFGVIKNPKTGEITTVPIPGFVASEFRTNLSKNAFNKNLTENQKPLKYNKDNIGQAMKDNGLDFLITNLDPRYTASTIRSGKPFMPLNVNDSNWSQSILLQKRVNSQGAANLPTIDIANLNNAKSTKEITDSISAIQKNIVKPASSFIPEPKEIDTSISMTVAVPKEATRVVLKTLESPLSAGTPVELKQSFEKNFGSNLTENQTTELFNKRNTITVEEGLNFLNKLSNDGNMDAVSLLKLDASNTYVNSGHLEFTGVGNALLKIPVKGKIKTNEQSQPLEAPTPTTTPSVESQDVSRIAATAKEVVPTTEPIKTAPTTTGSIVDKIVAAHGREASAVTKRMVPIEKSPIAEKKAIEVSLNKTADNTYQRAKNLIEETNPKGGGKYEPINPETGKAELGRGGAAEMAKDLLKMVSKIEPNNVSKADAEIIKEKIKPQLINDVAIRIRDIFNMPIDDVQKIITNINNTKEAQTIIKPKLTTDPNFFKKNPATKLSPYDILKSRRDKAAEGLIKWTKLGLKEAEPGSYSHSFSFALDSILSKKFGKNYDNNQEVRQLLGRAFGTESRAASKWKDLSEVVDTKGDLKSFDQPKDFLNALATGDKKARGLAMSKRLKALNKDRENSIGSLSETEISALGLEPGAEGGWKGMSIKTPLQEQDMIKGMAKGDFQLLPGLTSIQAGGAKETGPGGVRRGVEDARNVMQVIVKNHNESVAASRKYGSTGKSISQQFLTLAPEKGYTGKWENLSRKQKEAVDDKTNSYFDDIFNKYMEKLEIRDSKKKQATVGKERLSILEKRLERTEKALADPLERSNWETEQFLKNAIKEIKTDIAMYKSKVGKIISNK